MTVLLRELFLGLKLFPVPILCFLSYPFRFFGLDDCGAVVAVVFRKMMLFRTSVAAGSTKGSFDKEKGEPHSDECDSPLFFC